MIESGAKGLGEGQQHPFLQPLSNDGTVVNLIQLLKVRNKSNENELSLHEKFGIISKILANLFKATQIPSEIGLDAINILKRNHDYTELVYLAENKVLILGSEQNKRKVAVAIKDKVSNLKTYECQIEHQWDLETMLKKQESIRTFAEQIDEMIKVVLERIEQDGQFEDIDASQN
ncbi:MAG: hypothetical protein EZS28_028622 [Streblomastix strix]|uniref:Uncharacterized protein n=1 Tax=Streblomastix strix TaxID=222440 RepID=A0A5J4V0H5_9EUKA|nr:MAG: hypothetical protein EZS28_028622 [Streblomastix strix]